MSSSCTFTFDADSALMGTTMFHAMSIEDTRAWFDHMRAVFEANPSRKLHHLIQTQDADPSFGVLMRMFNERLPHRLHADFPDHEVVIIFVTTSPLMRMGADLSQQFRLSNWQIRVMRDRREAEAYIARDRQQQQEAASTSA